MFPFSPVTATSGRWRPLAFLEGSTLQSTCHKSPVCFTAMKDSLFPETPDIRVHERKNVSNVCYNFLLNSIESKSSHIAFIFYLAFRMWAASFSIKIYFTANSNFKYRNIWIHNNTLSLYYHTQNMCLVLKQKPIYLFGGGSVIG